MSIFTEQLIEQSAVEHGSNLSKYYNLPDILCQLELAPTISERIS